MAQVLDFRIASFRAVTVRERSHGTPSSRTFLVANIAKRRGGFPLVSAAPRLIPALLVRADEARQECRAGCSCSRPALVGQASACGGLEPASKQSIRRTGEGVSSPSVSVGTVRKTRETRQVLRKPAKAGCRLNACPTNKPKSRGRPSRLPHIEAAVVCIDWRRVSMPVRSPLRVGSDGILQRVGNPPATADYQSAAGCHLPHISIRKSDAFRVARCAWRPRSRSCRIAKNSA